MPSHIWLKYFQGVFNYHKKIYYDFFSCKIEIFLLISNTWKFLFHFILKLWKQTIHYPIQKVYFHEKLRNIYFIRHQTRSQNYCTKKLFWWQKCHFIASLFKHIIGSSKLKGGGPDLRSFAYRPISFFVRKKKSKFQSVIKHHGRFPFPLNSCFDGRRASSALRFG